ncbi:hypothetical protein Tco_0298532 [Tanacetum coccineum]
MIDRTSSPLRNSTNGDWKPQFRTCDNQRNGQTARPCFFTRTSMKCQPLNFKGTEGVVGLTRWIEKMESVFNISGCAIENQVKFATCTLLGAALTWWNGQIRTLGPEAYAMTWEVLKKKMNGQILTGKRAIITRIKDESVEPECQGKRMFQHTHNFPRVNPDIEPSLLPMKPIRLTSVHQWTVLTKQFYGNSKFCPYPRRLDETIQMAQ